MVSVEDIEEGDNVKIKEENNSGLGVSLEGVDATVVSLLKDSIVNGEQSVTDSAHKILINVENRKKNIMVSVEDVEN